MFKKIIGVIGMFLMMMCLQVTCFAQSSSHVIDEMGYLTSAQIDTLQQRIDQIGVKYTLDTVIVITDDLDGKSSRAYADDYYDYNGYGLDETSSGVLLLVDMKNRYVYISTTGRAIRLFNDQAIDRITERIGSKLASEKYDDACGIFLDQVEGYANNTYISKAIKMMKQWYTYVIMIGVAGVVTLGASAKPRTNKDVTNTTYETSGSFDLSETKDTYLRKSTSRTKIQKNSSGGSSTHRGSSGRSHGGGGKSF